jgi:hypothetical protein
MSKAERAIVIKALQDLLDAEDNSGNIDITSSTFDQMRQEAADDLSADEQAKALKKSKANKKKNP